MATANIAQGSRSQLLVKKQSALGTVATGNFDRLRWNTHSLNVVKQVIESGEIRSDREVAVSRHGNRNAAGEIVVELLNQDHDLLIQSAMFNTWTSDLIDIGVDPQYLSIEDGALDINQYRMFQDMLVNSMAVSIQPNAMLTATFAMVGTDGAVNTGTSAGGTPVEPTDNEPFDSFNASLYDNAAESGSEIAVVTGLNFTIENGVDPAFAVGQATPIAMQYGRGRVTGELTAYYTNADFINKFLAETEGVLVCNITDLDGNNMEFRFPRVKFNGATVPVANEQSRVITIPFAAIRDNTLGTALRISRV
jgi:hypothetical protein